jgi:septum formation protein
LGSDQVATVDGGILAKPGSLERAREQLTRSSGQTVLFLTGVVLARNGKKLGERCVLTHVTFRELRPREIERYLERETPFDCAGSFRWEGLGICLFRALQSTDPTALEGLPLIAVTDLLAENDLPVL